MIDFRIMILSQATFSYQLNWLKRMTIDIEISELIEEPEQYITLKNFMEQDDFPLFREYRNIKNYYHNLKERTKLETSSDDLFDN